MFSFRRDDCELTVDDDGEERGMRVTARPLSSRAMNCTRIVINNFSIPVGVLFRFELL